MTKLKQPTSKKKHDYTSELELKTLIIRVNNKTKNIGTTKENNRIDKYVRFFTAINNTKYSKQKTIQKRNKLKTKIKNKVVELSLLTQCSESVYDRFGTVLLLMIQNILKKPQYSGYSYKDEFYSDAVLKIIKYLHNFDHTKTSKRTNQPVNAFAYISQIIFHSIWYIILKKKKENNNLKQYQQQQQILSDRPISTDLEMLNSEYLTFGTETYRTKFFNLYENENIIKETNIIIENNKHISELHITYPNTYSLSKEEQSWIQSVQSNQSNESNESNENAQIIKFIRRENIHEQ